MIDVAYVLTGALTGFIVGVTGVGGGALLTPVLLLFFGVAPATAVATDLWFAAITKLVGAQIHRRSGHVDWQVVRRLWTGSLPAAVAVALLVSMGTRISKVEWLTEAIGGLVLVTAGGLLLAPRLLASGRGRRLENPGKLEAKQPALTVLAGAALGVCVALTSVGAGALGGVILLYLYPVRMTPRRMVATDLVHAIPLTMVAGLGYLVAGLIDWKMLWSLLAGSIPGIIVGSLTANRLPPRSMQVAIAIVLIAVAARILY
jgi:uncharacterized membrane protein YfcA